MTDAPIQQPLLKTDKLKYSCYFLFDVLLSMYPLVVSKWSTLEYFKLINSMSLIFVMGFVHQFYQLLIQTGYFFPPKKESQVRYELVFSKDHSQGRLTNLLSQQTLYWLFITGQCVKH